MEVTLNITSIKRHQSFFDLEDIVEELNFRSPTKEERESVNNFIDSISEDTGINFYDKYTS